MSTGINTDPNRVIIFDTTLRDGEQSPGCSMNLDEKLRVAKTLEGMGVDVIEAPWEQIGYKLIDRYFIIKNSEAIG